MIIIETKEPQPQLRAVSVANPVNFTVVDHAFLKSDNSRLLSSLFKGMIAALSIFAFSGYPVCTSNSVTVGLIAFISFSLVANEFFEQRVSGSRRADRDSLAHFTLKSVNPIYAVIPVLFMVATMNLQTLAQAVGNTVEVLGIACGVPLLLYGMIKIKEESNYGKAHVYVGSASALGGMALSILVNFAISSYTDMSVFSATNYFNNAIAAIYAPDVVLSFEQTSHSHLVE